MLTPGDRRQLAVRLARVADRCVRLARSIEQGGLRDQPRPPTVDRFESALTRLRRDKPVVVEHADTLPAMRFVPETGRIVRDESR